MKLTKDYNYFEALSKSAQYACEAARYLDETLRHFDTESFIGRMNEMHVIENAADELKHELMHHLSHEFMTPIEREDIVTMSQELDTVTDSIDDVMRRIYMFDLREIKKEALLFSELIVKCTAELALAVDELAHFRKSKTMSGHVVAVNSFESEGDKLHAGAMQRLFAERGENFRDTFVWMQMYECLETCLDACENTVDIVESVVMKNS